MSTIKTAGELGVQILQDVVLFDFIVGGSTGEKTVETDDFIREVGKTLPTGTFAWVGKYRAEAKREIMKVGVSRRVSNKVRGYFVPTPHAQNLAKVLTEIKEKYLAEKQVFLAGLPAAVEEWANAPENKAESKPGGKTRAELIRQHAPKASELDKMLTFDISAIRINDTSYFGEDDALQKEVKGLAGQAAYEIAEDVRKSWSGPGKGATTSRVLGLVRRVQDKAEAMSVLSSKFENLAKLCGEVLASVPTGQNIEGPAFIQVSALLTFCMDPDRILGIQSTEVDASGATDVTDVAAADSSSIFFNNDLPPTDQAGVSIEPAITIEPAVSIVSQGAIATEASNIPQFPADRVEEVNLFFDKQPQEVVIQPAQHVAEAQGTTAAFVF